MDPQDPSSRRRLPGPGGAAPEEQAGGEQARARHRGLRHVRRLSNWTAVGLVAATAVAAGYFARAGTTASTSPQQVTSVSGAQPAAPATSSSQACTTAVTAPVAISGGSGVIATVPGQNTPVPGKTAPAPGQTCAPGTGSTPPPAVVYAQPNENERGDS